MSEETKRKIGKKNKINRIGKKLSKETRAKLSDAVSGEKHPNYGKHRSDETKIKIGKTKGKPVRCIKTGNVYYSASYAEKKTGILASKISLVCNGKRKTTGGYHWEFVEKEV